MLCRRDDVVVRAGVPNQGCEMVIQIFVLTKKKVNLCNFSRDFKIGLAQDMYEFVTCLNTLGVREHIKIF